MKKLLFVVLTFILMFSLCGCGEGLSLLYTETVQTDDLFIGINKTANCCYVGAIDANDSDTDITIPDTYNDIPITRIGGYYGRGVPTPFYIDIYEGYVNAEEGSEYTGVICGPIDEYEFDIEYTVEDIQFTLNLGKNIEVIEYADMNLYYPHTNDDGSITFYHPVVYINCSEENEHFYSKDGMLYDKTNDELITDFSYFKNNN